jgi:DNA (cytosine-5)-methyltransferase 1
MGTISETDTILNTVKLFAGIDAPGEALKNIGISDNTLAYVEWDKFAVKSYNAINGTNYKPIDINGFDSGSIREEIDLLVHGSPCQSFSVAGKQEGGDEGSGTQSSLLYRSIEIIIDTTPKVVVWENVKNVLSKKHRHNFDNYLETLEDLGYTNYWEVLNAKDYGVPQNRERVFCVSILGEHTPYAFPSPVELKMRLADVLEDEVDEKFYLSDTAIEYMSRERNGKPRWEYHKNEVGGVASCLTANMYKGVPYGVITPSIEMLGLLNIKGNEQVRRVYGVNGISPCLNTMQGGSREPKVVVNSRTPVWVAVVGYEGLYEVSDTGSIRSLDKVVPTGITGSDTRTIKGKVLSCKIDKDGYKNIQLTKNKVRKDYRVHRLVLASFTHLDNTLEVNHKDGVKDNNKLSNLEYCTTLENQQHRNNVLKKRGKYGQKRGVNWNRDKGKWVAFIKLNNKSVFLGYSSNKEECYDLYFDAFLNEFGYEPWDISNRQPKIVAQRGRYNNDGTTSQKLEPRKDDITNTITTVQKDNLLLNEVPPRIRKLTPRECWRLMSFSDEAFDKAQAVNSNSQLYKQAGNSIVVKVLEEIFKNLFKG